MIECEKNRKIMLGFDPMKDADRKRLFVQELWLWYGRHKRRLPWRDLSIKEDTDRAYRILVSEVMLQQTQVERVKIVFKNFLERFPHIEDLAKATNKEIILAWRGMGYNSRALRLRDAAAIIVSDRKGIFPRELDQLRSIKGIGPYTASAVRNFAFNLPTPCIDTNIRRILHRTFVGPENPDGTWSMSDKELMEIAEEVLDEAVDDTRTAAEWHAALMDFGSLVQTKTNPKWNICPLSAKGIMRTTPDNFPTKNQKLKTNKRLEPGRFEGAKYVPNRIFRGRIVELLRDEERGLTLEDIGPRICIDWEEKHHAWLQNLITKLVQERMILERNRAYVLFE